MKKIKIVLAPVYEGARFKGTELSPEIIIKKINKKEYIKPVFKEQKNAYDKINNIKNYNTILYKNKILSKIIEDIYIEGNFPFVIGGDHSIGFSTLSSFSNYYSNGAVIWIDAHSDINTPETTLTGNAHGMPLSSAIGIGDEKLCNLFSNKIKPENIFLIGTRDIDFLEEKIIDKYNVNNFSMEQIDNDGLQTTIDYIIKKLQSMNIDSIYFSLDVDSIDPEIIDGTGTPVKDGFNVIQIKYIIKTFFKTGFIKGADIVEYNPNLDRSTKSKDIVVELTNYMMDSILGYNLNGKWIIQKGNLFIII